MAEAYAEALVIRRHQRRLVHLKQGFDGVERLIWVDIGTTCVVERGLAVSIRHLRSIGMLLQQSLHHAPLVARNCKVEGQASLAVGLRHSVRVHRQTPLVQLEDLRRLLVATGPPIIGGSLDHHVKRQLAAAAAGCAS